MRLLFLHPIELERFFGPMYISAVLKKHGHYCDVLMESDPDKIVKYLKKTDFDFVGFSAMTPMHRWVMKVARRIKEETDCKTIIGGVHPTLYPEIVEKECIDFVCRGEGEYAMLEFANKYDAGEDLTDIKNIWTVVDDEVKENPVRPLIEDLDELPFPDRDMYYDKYPEMKRIGTYRISSGRGCPFNCSYCYNHLFKKIHDGKCNFVRKRSPENIIKELGKLKGNNPKKVDFAEDTFFYRSRSKWLDKFLNLYNEKIDIPFGIQVHPKIMRRGDIRKLKESKCYSIRIGVETGNEEVRKEVLNKNVSDEEIMRTARLVKKSGIDLVTYNMVGLPGETLNDALETVRFNRKLNPDYTICGLLQPFPKTQIAEYAKEHGYLPEDYSLEDYIGKINNIRNIWFNFYGKSKYQRELTNLAYLFQIAVKFPKTMPLIRYMIKKPTNRIYELIRKAIHGYNHIQSYKMEKIPAISLAILKSLDFEKV